MDPNKARQLAAQAEARKMYRLADALKRLAEREEAARKFQKKVFDSRDGCGHILHIESGIGSRTIPGETT